MQHLGGPLEDPASRSDAGMHDLFSKNIKLLTPQSESKFERDGIYSSLDALLDTEIEVQRRQTSTIRKALRRIANPVRKVLFSAVGGAAVGSLTSILSGNDPAAGAEQGAIYGSILGTSAEAIRYSVGYFVKAGAKDIWGRIREKLEKENNQTALNTVQYFSNVVQLEPVALAKTYILRSIEVFEKEKSVAGPVIRAPITGAVKGGFTGFIFNLVSPMNIDLGTAASIGAAANILDNTYDALTARHARHVYDAKLRPIISELSTLERAQLIGGLVNRWCPSYDEQSRMQSMVRQSAAERRDPRAAIYLS